MAGKSRTQIRLEYIAALAVLRPLQMLPRKLALLLCRVIARVGYYSLGGLRRVGMRNLEIAFPEKSIAQRKRILMGAFGSLGRVLGELSQLHKATPEKLAEIIDFKFDDESYAVYEKSQAEGRGILITTGHLGNWEMLVMGFAALYKPIAYLARPLDNPLIEEMTVRMRSRFGNQPINKTNSAMRAVEILREDLFLGMLSDVNAHPKEGVFVPFFGVPACTPSGAAVLALRANALIYPTFCVWDREFGKYRFVHGDLLEPVRTGNRENDVLATTALYTAEIEKFVRAYPDQWMWIHKRWKTRPPGEKDLYAKDE